MPRIIITIPKKMRDALQRESDRTNAPVAALVREAIEEWAQKRGIDVKDTISWGGARKTIDGEDKTADEIVAVA